MIYTINNNTAYNYSKFIARPNWIVAIFKKSTVYCPPLGTTAAMGHEQPKAALLVAHNRQAAAGWLRDQAGLATGLNMCNDNKAHVAVTGTWQTQQHEKPVPGNAFECKPLLCCTSDLAFFNLRGYFSNVLKAVHLCWIAARNNKRLLFICGNQGTDEAKVGNILVHNALLKQYVRQTVPAINGVKNYAPRGFTQTPKMNQNRTSGVETNLVSRLLRRAAPLVDPEPATVGSAKVNKNRCEQRPIKSHNSKTTLGSVSRLSTRISQNKPTQQVAAAGCGRGCVLLLEQQQQRTRAGGGVQHQNTKNPATAKGWSRATRSKRALVCNPADEHIKNTNLVPNAKPNVVAAAADRRASGLVATKPQTVAIKGQANGFKTSVFHKLVRFLNCYVPATYNSKAAASKTATMSTQNTSVAESKAKGHSVGHNLKQAAKQIKLNTLGLQAAARQTAYSVTPGGALICNTKVAFKTIYNLLNLLNVHAFNNVAGPTRFDGEQRLLLRCGLGAVGGLRAVTADTQQRAQPAAAGTADRGFRRQTYVKPKSTVTDALFQAAATGQITTYAAYKQNNKQKKQLNKLKQLLSFKTKVAKGCHPTVVAATGLLQQPGGRFAMQKQGLQLYNLQLNGPINKTFNSNYNLLEQQQQPIQELLVQQQSPLRLRSRSSVAGNTRRILFKPELNPLCINKQVIKSQHANVAPVATAAVTGPGPAAAALEHPGGRLGHTQLRWNTQQHSTQTTAAPGRATTVVHKRHTLVARALKNLVLTNKKRVGLVPSEHCPSNPQQHPAGSPCGKTALKTKSQYVQRFYAKNRRTVQSNIGYHRAGSDRKGSRGGWRANYRFKNKTKSKVSGILYRPIWRSTMLQSTTRNKVYNVRSYYNSLLYSSAFKHYGTFANNAWLKQADVIFFFNASQHKPLVNQAKRLQIPTIGIVSGSTTDPLGRPDYRTYCLDHGVHYAIIGNAHSIYFVSTLLPILIKVFAKANMTAT